ncbi:MAG: NADH-quinone oxidoreductase subunit C [Deltaproteobacteria bacterium]|nr:NADH-quinone oxidoreductase subunit C [Deltaproteobacteria bacterium]
MVENLPQDNPLIKRIKDRFGAAILDTDYFRGEITHTIKKDTLLDLCRFLKEDPELNFNFLVDVCGVDYLPQPPRFEVVYHFYSIPKKHRLRIKVRTEDGETVPSVTSIWKAANWVEREAYDMFGIVFEGHPDLRRIYMPQDWEGFPLRKDYPLRGYKDQYNPFGEERNQ